MDKHEARAVAQAMSGIYGGYGERHATDDAAYENGRLCDVRMATPEEREFAAISRLRWNMEAGTHGEDRAHIFHADGSASPYSLLDLDIERTRKEADSLRGTQYEAEAEEIMSAVSRRREKFLEEVERGALMKRESSSPRFRIIDHWDLNAPSAREENPRAEPKRGERNCQGERAMKRLQLSTPRRGKTPAEQGDVLSAALKAPSAPVETQPKPARCDRQMWLFGKERDHA